MEEYDDESDTFIKRKSRKGLNVHWEDENNNECDILLKSNSKNGINVYQVDENNESQITVCQMEESNDESDMVTKGKSNAEINISQIEPHNDESFNFRKRISWVVDNDAQRFHQQIEDQLLGGLDLEQLESIVYEKGYCSLLHLYCKTRHEYTKTVKLIIESGADVNKVNKYGRTPIYSAIVYKQGNDALSTMENLLNHTFLKQKNPRKKKATLYNSDIQRRDIVNHKDIDGWTPLMFACKWGNFEKVKFLVENGADITTPTKLGLSAICFASGSMTIHTLKFLLQKIPNHVKDKLIKFKQESKRSLCCYTNCSWCSEVVNIYSVLLSACNSKNRDNCVYLIKEGFRIGTNSANLIEHDRHLEWVIPLLSKDYLRPDDVSIHNNTTLQLTIMQEQNEAALYMLDHTNIGNENLLKALVLSVKYRSIPLVINKIVQKLQSARVDIPFETIYRKAGIWPCRTQNFTLLHIAIDYGITQHVKILLSKDPICAEHLLDDQEGTTIVPFFLAMKHPHLWHVIDISRIFQYEQNILPKQKLNEAAAVCYPRSDTICLPSLYYDEHDHSWLRSGCQLLSGEHLTDLLADNDIGPVLRSGENQQITEEVVKILQNVSKMLVSKTKNPYLEFTPVLSGSNSDGTKAILPDEYDFLLVLSKLSKIMHIMPPTCCPENQYVNFKLKSSPTVDMDFFSEGLLNKRDFLHKFEKEFMESLNSIKTPSNLSIVKTNYEIRSPEDLMKISVRWLGDQHEDLIISIDLSPAVCISPEDLEYNRNICLPVTDKTHELYAIFKGSGSSCHPPDLRLSFSEVEKGCISSASEAARRGLILAKAMRSNLVCPSLQEPNTMNFVTAEESITSYFLKTCFLHLLDRHKNREDVLDSAIYDDYTVTLESVEWADKIYDVLEHYLGEWNHIPHFFNSDWDILFKDLYTWQSLEECGEHNAQLYKQSIKMRLEHCGLIKEMLSSMKKHMTIRSKGMHEKEQVCINFRDNGKAEKELIYIDKHYRTGFYTGPLEREYLQYTPITVIKFLAVLVLIIVVIVIALVIFKVI